MPRYERHDEHGDRFCSLRAVGDMCVIRKGALGSYGRATLEPHRDEAQAQARVAELGEQLCAQGYVEVPEQTTARDQPFDPELKRMLEEALREDPGDREAWAVYADLLAGFMPELGQRIVLELAREAAPPEGTTPLTARIRELDRRYRRRWAGRELAKFLNKRGKPCPGLELSWRYGFIDGARLRWSQLDRTHGGLPGAYEALLDSPATRVLTRLHLSFDYRYWANPPIERSVLTRVSTVDERISLRRLSIESRGREPLELNSFLCAHPRLTRLHLAGALTCKKRGHHEPLRRLSLHPREADLSYARALARVELPGLERFELRLISEDGSGASWASAVLDDILLPCTELTHLTIYQRCRAGPWLHELLRSRLLGRLRELDLNLGMDHRAVELMLDNRRRFARLEHLRISGRCFIDGISKALREALPQLDLRTKR